MGEWLTTIREWGGAVIKEFIFLVVTVAAGAVWLAQLIFGFQLPAHVSPDLLLALAVASFIVANVRAYHRRRTAPETTTAPHVTIGAISGGRQTFNFGVPP